MKFATGVILLFVIAFAVANDVEDGERQEGDQLVFTRRLIRPPIWNIEMVAKTGYNTKGVITAVTAVNAPGTDANVTIVKGGAGKQNVVVLAVGRPGRAVDVRVKVYALELPPNATTTEPPKPTEP